MEFLSKGGANVNIVMNNGQSALHISAINGILKFEKNESPSKYDDLIALGMENVTDVLINNGANINIVDNIQGNSALHYAAEKGNSESLIYHINA